MSAHWEKRSAFALEPSYPEASFRVNIITEGHEDQPLPLDIMLGSTVRQLKGKIRFHHPDHPEPGQQALRYSIFEFPNLDQRMSERLNPRTPPEHRNIHLSIKPKAQTTSRPVDATNEDFESDGTTSDGGGEDQVAGEEVAEQNVAAQELAKQELSDHKTAEVRATEAKDLDNGEIGEDLLRAMNGDDARACEEVIEGRIIQTREANAASLNQEPTSREAHIATLIMELPVQEEQVDPHFTHQLPTGGQSSPAVPADEEGPPVIEKEDHSVEDRNTNQQQATPIPQQPPAIEAPAAPTGPKAPEAAKANTAAAPPNDPTPAQAAAYPMNIPRSRSQLLATTFVAVLFAVHVVVMLCCIGCILASYRVAVPPPPPQEHMTRRARAQQHNFGEQLVRLMTWGYATSLVLSILLGSFVFWRHT